MKTPKKSVKQPAVKGKSQESDSSKKTKLKPVSAKESKNWKNKLDDEDDDLEVDSLTDDYGDETEEDIEDITPRHAFEDHYEEDDDRY